METKRIRAVVFYCLLSTFCHGEGKIENDKIYLAYHISTEAVITEVIGTVVSTQRLWVQLWRRATDNRLKYKLLYQKTFQAESIDGTSVIKKISFRNSNGMCPIGFPDYKIGVLSDKQPFPLDYNRTFNTRIIDYRVNRGLPNIGNIKEFGGVSDSPILIDINTRPLSAQEQRITDQNDLQMVKCDPPPKPTTSESPGSTEPPTSDMMTTNPVTTPGLLATISSAAGSENALSPLRVHAMYGGFGALGGVLVTIVIVLVIWRTRRAKSSKKTPSPADPREASTVTSSVCVGQRTPPME